MARRLRFGLWYDFRNPPQWRQDPTRLYRGIVDAVRARRGARLGRRLALASTTSSTTATRRRCCRWPARSPRARRTIQIGTSVLLLPLHDPLRVAEDAATVDVMSGGRFQLGVAVGYRKGEFTGFGIPARERAARMNEALPILRRLFAGERVTTTDARFYRYTDVELRPLPVQRAHEAVDRRLLRARGAPRRAARRRVHLDRPDRAARRDLSRRAAPRSARIPTRTRSPRASPGSSSRAIPRSAGARPRQHFLYQINLYAQWFGEAGMQIAAVAKSRADLANRGAMIVSPEQARRRDPPLRRRAADHALLRLDAAAGPAARVGRRAPRAVRARGDATLPRIAATAPGS